MSIGAPTRAPTRGAAAPRATAAALLLAVGALLVLLWWSGGRPPEAEPAIALQTPRAGATPSAMHQDPDPVVDAVERIETTTRPEPVDLDLPYTFGFEVRVYDPFGLPVPDAHLFVAPPACGFSLLPEPTDARGIARLCCRGRQPRLPLWIAVLANGVVEPLRSLDLDADRPAVLTVVARGRAFDDSELERLLTSGADKEQLQAWAKHQRRMLARERRETEPAAEEAPRRGRLRRRDELDLLCGRLLFLFREVDCLVCHEPSRVGAYTALQRAPELALGLHPFATLRDQPPRPLSQQELERRRRELRAPAPEVWERRLVDALGPAGSGILSGRVVDADGVAAVGVPVAWLGHDGALLQRTVTDAGGAYRLRLPAGRNLQVVAGGGSLGRADAIVCAVPLTTLVQEFTLRRQQVIEGKAADERGGPLVDWLVEYEGVGEAVGALAGTRADGTFTLSLTGRAGRCLLWPAEPDLRLPTAVSELALPDGPGISFHLDERAPSRARLRLRPVLPAKHPNTRVELRVLQVDSQRGAFLARSGFDEVFELEGLPPGFYRGEVGAPGLGWVPFGPLHLDGRGLWDLGAVVLPLPGRVRFVPERGARSPLAGACEFWRREHWTDVGVEAVVEDEWTARLPAGSYVVLWVDDGSSRAAAFTLAPGGEALVPLHRR